MSVPFITNVLYPGEDALYVHRFELLQGADDPSPGQPFSPAQYQDWTNWTFPEEISVRPPSTHKRRTRMPTAYGDELFTFIAAIHATPTDGYLELRARSASTALAQDSTELFAEWWGYDAFGRRRNIANLRWIVENSVNPTA